MINKKTNRIRRHKRVRAKVFGTSARPRLSVFRSNRLIHLQAIDDQAQKTLFAASGSDPAAAGKILAEKAKAVGIRAVVFDRGGFQYHGRVKKVADAIREAEIKI